MGLSPLCEFDSALGARGVVCRWTGAGCGATGWAVLRADFSGGCDFGGTEAAGSPPYARAFSNLGLLKRLNSEVLDFFGCKGGSAVSFIAEGGDAFSMRKEAD